MNDADSPAFAAERAAMVHEIADEVALTADQTGRSRLDPRVLAAMATVPRHRFVPENQRDNAYTNGPLPIGHRQTISQPYMVALMTDLLAPRADHRVLEIGTGSGYQSAVLSALVAHVDSVEIVGALADEAGQRLAALGCANVTVHHADGYFGWPAGAPYDGIIVTAAAPSLPPALIEQLGSGGCLVAPLGTVGGVQSLKRWRKNDDGTCAVDTLLMVAFVPLTRELRGV